MDPARNPYTPGSGLRPPELVGRDDELQASDLLFQRVESGLTGRSLMIYGLRGVGKTVLLNEMYETARSRGWLTAMFEAKSDRRGAEQARTRLARDLTASARSLEPWHKKATRKVKTAVCTIESFSVRAGVGPVAAGAPMTTSARAGSGDIELDIEELVADTAPALTESGIGMAVFVDEIQDLDAPTLSALLSAQHRAAQSRWPFYVFGAGLPVVPARLSEVRSYAERQFDYRRVDQLHPVFAEDALTRPASMQDVGYTPEASKRILDAAQGYPYFIQVFGDQAWRTALRSPIDEYDADDAVLGGVRELDRSLFASRWDRATQKQKQVMIAMSEDDGPSAIADLVTRMGKKKQGDLSVFRRELITKGLVYSPDRGSLAFTIPLMADYIRRRGHEG